jgi:hypothetical protein
MTAAAATKLELSQPAAGGGFGREGEGGDKGEGASLREEGEDREARTPYMGMGCGGRERRRWEMIQSNIYFMSGNN